MDEGRPPDPETGAEPVDATDETGAGVPMVDAGAGAPADDLAFEPGGPSRGIVAIVIVLIAALVVFAVVGGRIATSSPEPTPRAEPRLAVTDGAGRFFTMDRDGGAVTEHAVPDVQFAFPAWSPDATRIAITGEGKNGIRLYLFGAADDSQGMPTIIYDDPDHPPFYLYWSPDGQQIAFLTTEPGGIALRVLPADGSAEARIVREGAPLYWDWLGNDHLVAHIGFVGADAFLGEVDLKGASTETVPLDPGYFRSPAVSRDGRYRAYVTSGQNTAGTVTVETIDRASRQSAPVFGVAAVSFDPTGSTLAYVGAERPVVNDPGIPLGPLRALDPVSGRTRTLLGGDVVAFFWSPDGQTIAALTIPGPNDEIVGVPGAGLVSAAGTAPGAGTDPEPPPPAQGVRLTLAFVDVDSARVRASRAARITSRFVSNILPYYDQYALSHRVWAPDSSAIVMPLEAEGKDQLFVIPADGSAMTPLDDAELGFWSP
jgi:TolB protein